MSGICDVTKLRRDKASSYKLMRQANSLIYQLQHCQHDLYTSSNVIAQWCSADAKLNLNTLAARDAIVVVPHNTQTGAYRGELQNGSVLHDSTTCSVVY